MVNTDKKTIDEILDRGIIVDAIPSLEEFREKLLSGDKLKFYIGFDPTSTALHLGHARNIMVLEEFRKLGHEVIALFGDFTAMVGDPSGKESARKQLSKEEVLENVKNWEKHIRPLMDFDNKENPPKIKYNSEWLSKLSFEDVVNLASNFTVQQMIERDMFQKRIAEKKPVFLNEFLYPLMQGYDSVAMGVDVEMCGTDQIFNALAGRTLLKKLKNKDKFVVVLGLIANPKTGELMSKSHGTGVFIDSTPSDMFGAIMSQADEMTEILLVNNTRISLSKVRDILKEEPMEAKKITAFEIVKIFYGEGEARVAQTSFENTFQGRKFFETDTVVKVQKGKELKECLLLNNYVSSAAEFRRLVKDGAIDFDGETIDDARYKIEKPGIVRIGKKKFVKLEF
ncbi:tyrosine--tRNA ligase [Patescibacteria group bacterium]|nr:tyrosine--tRNA ligase [Patescibacteria group bacterium]